MPSPRLTAAVALLMEKEPTNLQAQSLMTLIDSKVTRGTLRVILLRFAI